MQPPLLFGSSISCAHYQSLYEPPHLWPLAATALLSISTSPPVLDISCKWSPNGVDFCAWCLWLSIMFSKFVHVELSVPWLNNIPVYRYITFVFIHSSAEVFGNGYFHFSWAYPPRVVLLDYMVILCLTSEEPPETHHFIFLYQDCDVSTPSLTHVTVFLLITTIVTSLKTSFTSSFLVYLSFVSYFYLIALCSFQYNS